MAFLRLVQRPLHNPALSRLSILQRTFASMSAPISSSAEAVKPASAHTPTRTVLVLGASYAGHRAAQMLSTQLPPDWRVVALERNTHFNHLYAFPRVSVLPGHEQKVFVPYTRIFNPPTGAPAIAKQSIVVQGSLTHLERAQPGQVGRGVARYLPVDTDKEESIAFDYAVYALGSQLPPPINVWSTASSSSSESKNGTLDPSETTSRSEVEETYRDKIAEPQQPGSKKKGMAWLKDTQKKIRDAHSVLVIGGGALGVQYASDIAYLYGTPTTAPVHPQEEPSVPRKKVTLLSSRSLLPRFRPWMHEEAKKRLEALGVEVITDARADLSTLDDSKDASNKDRVIKTLDGRQLQAEVVLFCTGQRPNSSFLEAVEPGVVNESNGMAFVNRHLQLATPSKEGEPQTKQGLNHIFVVGDAADAFDALNAGHTAFEQANYAARNIARLVASERSLENGFAGLSVDDGGDEKQQGWEEWEKRKAELGTELEKYEPEGHRIKVSVGFREAIIQRPTEHITSSEGADDLNTPNMWKNRGLDTADLFV